MGQTDKLIVVLRIGAEPPDGHGHAVLQVPVQPGLGAVGLLKIVQELLRGHGELKLLGTALEFRPDGLHFVHRGLFRKIHKNCSSVPVGDGNAEALSRNGRLHGVGDDAVFHMAPDLHGLLLRLLLFAADVGDQIIRHLRPRLERLTGAGDRLVCADQDLLQTETAQGMKSGHIALDGAVGLDCDEPAPHPQSLSLCLHHFNMLGVQFRNHHGHVGRPAVGAVIRDHRALLLGIHHHQVFGLLGDGGIHSPAAAHGLFIGFARRAGAGRDDLQFEPGMVLHQSHKALSHHAGAADHANLVLFHAADLHCLVITILYRKQVRVSPPSEKTAVERGTEPVV